MSLYAYRPVSFLWGSLGGGQSGFLQRICDG